MEFGLVKLMMEIDDYEKEEDEYEGDDGDPVE